MKYRESGMPNEEMWDTFFNPTQILSQLYINENVNNLIDIGCGYGTFIIPAAKLVKGIVIGIDIDGEMIETCKGKILEQGIQNIELLHGDISTEQTAKELEKYNNDIDYICLFNILHCEQPLDLLNAAYRVIGSNGKLGVIHWKYENNQGGRQWKYGPPLKSLVNWH
jgi:ubiquinone/menaquinone biosynthesis C-methylase UbiE